MFINLRNEELAPAIAFLQAIPLKATDSRHRSKLVKLLTVAYEELASSEKILMDKFGLLDADGSLKAEQDRSNENVKMFNLEQRVLYSEIVVIEGGMFVKNVEEIPRILKEFNGEISGKDAEIYDRLLDEFEKTNNDEEEK